MVIHCSFAHHDQHSPDKNLSANKSRHTVGGRNPANLLKLVVYPIIYEGFIHPNGGCGWDF